MNTTHILTLSALVLARTCCAGTITGHVHAEGKPGTDQTAAGGAYASHALKFAEKVNYAEWRDFVVYIDGPVAGVTPVTADKPAQTVSTIKVSQHHAVFSPHVLPVMVGTTVAWPNNDDIFHNVFSYSEAKPFDLGLYKTAEDKHPEQENVIFDKPGQVDVFCSIHANMSCVVLVLQNPFFAVSRENGTYSITNVPPGTYKLKAWHERVPVQVREVTVPDTGDVKVDFTLGINNLPKH
jgi:plastocyanin